MNTASSRISVLWTATHISHDARSFSDVGHLEHVIPGSAMMGTLCAMDSRRRAEPKLRGLVPNLQARNKPCPNFTKSTFFFLESRPLLTLLKKLEQIESQERTE
jgi:hypothetical protein